MTSNYRVLDGAIVDYIQQFDPEARDADARAAILAAFASAHRQSRDPRRDGIAVWRAKDTNQHTWSRCKLVVNEERQEIRAILPPHGGWRPPTRRPDVRVSRRETTATTREREETVLVPMRVQWVDDRIVRYDTPTLEQVRDAARNSANNPLYLLCFAVGNERGKNIALRIAEHLLKEVR